MDDAELDSARKISIVNGNIVYTRAKTSLNSCNRDQQGGPVMSGEKHGSKSSKPLHLLPDDLIYAILSRMPTKSVIRFMCLSKTWIYFIQHDPYFLRLRQNLMNPTNDLFLCVYPRFYPFDQATEMLQPDIFLGHVPIHEDQGPLELDSSTYILSMPNLSCWDLVVESVNGLLCLHPKLSNSCFMTHICNPTTRQVVTLPHDNAIDFYPKFSLLTHFGYDPLGDKFKVLNIILNEANLFQELRILTIGDYVWRHVTHDIPYALKSNIDPLKHIGTCVNGAIHWLDSIHKVIMSFDVGSEQFREIPIFEFDDLKRYRLIEFSGCLSLLIRDMKRKLLIDLSILKDYENHVWIHERIILTKNIVFGEGYYIPLCRVYTQEILLLPSSLDSYNSLRVRYYDTKRRSFRRISALKVPIYFSEVFHLIGLKWFAYQENFKQL